MKSLLVAGSLMALAGTAGAQGVERVAPELMRRVAPGLADYTDEVLFGDVWKRPGLAPRERSLVTVSALIATGKTGQLTGHLGRALDNGVKPVEIGEVITHLAFYSGWPSAVSALPVADQVFRQRGIEDAALRPSTGARLSPSSTDAARAAAVDERVAPVAPKLADLTDAVLFGSLWRRPDLSPRDRSLVTIAALAAGGDSAQLAFHARRGLENGLTREEVVEAITHLAFYAGWPKAFSALPVAAGAMAEADAAAPRR